MSRAQATTLFCFGLCLAILAPALARAEREGGEDVVATPLHRDGERTRVAVRLEGALDAATERALSALLEAELAPSGLRATLERAASPLGDWIERSRSRSDVLLVVAIDARERDALRLYVIDAARGLAIQRQLPGGIEANAASLEAIVSIIGSAATALRDGLELVSKPLAEVVPEMQGSRPSEPRAAEASTRTAKALETPPRAETASRATTSEPDTHFGARLALGVASFASGEAPSYGVAPAFVVRSNRRIGIHLETLLCWPNALETSLGDFSVRRTRVGLTLGYTWSFADLALEPELGAGLEHLARAKSVPVPAVRASDEASFVRLGPLAKVRVRYHLTRLLALEAAATAAYFPREVRFVARDATTRELVSPSPISVGAELGVSIPSWKE